MILKVISSNSSGNAYILENDQEALLIECGVPFRFIKQALNFNLSKVKGCILTHNHADHSKAAEEVLAAGIDVYASPGTHEAIGTYKNRRAMLALSGYPSCIGGFTVKPFDVKHDAAEPLGYLIRHSETGVILFLTDSYYSEYKFPGLNNIIIEANYCEQILDARLKSGEDPRFLRDRVIQSHMSLQTCKLTLSANDLSQVNNIVLIHLSDRNSDAKRFKLEVEEETGKQVHVARPGLEISFNKQPF
jgi:phosphoribosyl 1,2-cyclic phosphodiesterase